jgi:membrane fusion protein, copper/silver efflux system
MKKFLLLALVAAIAAAAGWFAAKRSGGPKPAASSGARKVLYYQSPMHPWITSDKPGRCTICGMQLEPVFEGERGFGGTEGVVMLGSNSVQVINVQTEVVTNRALSRTLRVAGVIDDDDTRHRRLSAYAEGRIEKLFVNHLGAEVIEGQPLAVLYSPGLLATESEYLTLLRQGAAPDLSATVQQERARLIEAAAQRLKRLGYSDAQLAALAKKEAADARTEILAPMTGTVVSRNVYEGQYVKEGDLLFEIGDFSVMWFQFDAYERDLGGLHVGQMVEVTSSSLPGKILSAPIKFIDPNLNEMTRSAKVRVELENPMVDEGGRKRRLLYHRLFAEGTVKLQSASMLTVPRSAVLSAGQPVVYVEVGPGAYEQRAVKLGQRGDDFWEVLSGVQAGERVVTTGNLLIDAQAQLNASTVSMSGSGKPPQGQSSNMTNGEEPMKTAAPATSETQLAVAKEFFTLTSDLGAALAADSLPLFNERAPRVHALVPKLIDAFGPTKSLRPTLAKFEQSGHLETAKDLAAARKEFLPFSMATAELAALLRTQPGAPAVKIYNCPMVNRAIPGADKNGRWVQTEGPLRNPFFGAQMLECGSEVK